MDSHQEITSKNNRLLRIGEKIYGASSQTERLIFSILIAVVVISGILIAWRINNSFLIAVADSGGTIEEGIIGIPRFINPVLSASDADRDLTVLVYSGLLKSTPEGKVIPDLAKEFSISEDGRSYRFILKDGLTFQDGKPVTTDDIEFTIQKIQDSTIKSPKRPIWDGVAVAKTSPKEIIFTLRQARASFIDDLTVGILPKHIWKDVPTDEFSFSQFNVSPIGSGPYKIRNIKRNSIGLPIYYELSSFKNYTPSRAYISHMIIKFYQNEKELLAAYENGDVESLNGISPSYAMEIKNNTSKIVVSTLPRIFGVFFNQNQATVFVNKEVRQALDLATDKNQIVKDVLNGYGKVIDSPVTPKFGSTDKQNATSTSKGIDAAISLLRKNGWALNAKTGIMEKKIGKDVVALKFSLATGDAPELKQAAEMIKSSWAKIGASVDVKIFEIGDLNQNIIRPRKYDALFFGEVVGQGKDLFPFWHSSQRNDPGLNISLYTNLKTDKLLEDIRATNDAAIQEDKLNQFEAIIKDDVPAVFIYAPEFIYIVPNQVQNIKLGQITNSGERFLNVNEWYVNTNKVWKIFTK